MPHKFCQVFLKLLRIFGQNFDAYYTFIIVMLNNKILLNYIQLLMGFESVGIKFRHFLLSWPVAVDSVLSDHALFEGDSIEDDVHVSVSKRDHDMCTYNRQQGVL